MVVTIRDHEHEPSAFAFIDTEKEIVVYHSGWGFSLPSSHTVKSQRARHAGTARDATGNRNLRT